MAREDYPSVGVSDATLKRGYSKTRDPDLEPKTITLGSIAGESIRVDNPARMVYDPATGEMEDAYAGGFLRRTPHCPDDR